MLFVCAGEKTDESCIHESRDLRRHFRLARQVVVVVAVCGGVTEPELPVSTTTTAAASGREGRGAKGMRRCDNSHTVGNTEEYFSI